MMMTHKRLAGHVALWIVVLGLVLWYYLSAGTQLWEGAAETYFSPGWLMYPVFFGIFLFVGRASARESAGPRKWHSLLRVLIWTFVPWILLAGERSLIRLGIENFCAYPSPRTFQAISGGGAFFLWGLLASILFAPLSGPSKDEEEPLYSRCWAATFVLGSGLAVLIGKRLLLGSWDNSLLPVAQIVLFRHQFQHLGILLLFLFFLRIDLPLTVLELSRKQMTTGV